MELVNQVLLVTGLLVLLSILASAFMPRLGAPLLLVFLLVGMLAGVDGPGGISFQNFAVANFAGTAALAVILYDGGLRTRLADFRTGLWPALGLSIFGVPITMIITAGFAKLAFDLAWPQALLIGAIVSSTDAAAVFSLLNARGSILNRRVGSVLEIESGTNDPTAVMLTLALLLYIGAPQQFDWSTALFFLLRQLTLGFLLGWAGGRLIHTAINRLDLGEALYPLLALFGGLLVFGLTGTLGGSGFLAVYLAGLVVGNGDVRGQASIQQFHHVIAWLAQIGLFVMLGMLVSPSHLLSVALPALAVALALILVARPLAVLLTVAPFRFPRRELGFIAWVGLRGSVPIVLATYPLMSGTPHAQVIFDTVFFIVLVSLVLQGWTVASAARLLKLRTPQPAARVHRMDLDLPGSQGYEVVSYRLAKACPMIGKPPQLLPLREPTRLVSVSRRGRVLAENQWDALQIGDYVSLLASRHEVEDLDRLFESEPLPQEMRSYFGDFIIDPDAPMQALADLYGAHVPADVGEHSVSGFIAKHLLRPVVGDRLQLGPVDLVIRQMEGSRITALGLRFAEAGDEVAAVDDDGKGAQTG